MQLAEEEQREINRLVTEAEAKSGAQLLVVIIGKADAYPEIPWKAFAIGASFAAFVATLLAVLDAQSRVLHPAFFATAISSAGASFALVAIFVPAFARFFLSGPRAEAEVRQYAHSAFLEREVFATRERVGVLLLISRFERQAAIVSDTGVRRHVTAEQLAMVEMQMRPLLAQRRMAAACKAGLSTLTLLLEGLLTRPAGSDEIADALIQERGA